MRNQNIAICTLIGLLGASGCNGGRRPIDGAQPNPRIATAIDLGSVPPSTEFEFLLGLHLRAPAQLHEFLKARETTQDELGSDDFADAFAISAGEYSRIVTWLRAHDLEVVRVTAGRTTITIHATAEAIQRAFGTEIHQFQDVEGRFQASINGLQLLPELAPTVSGTIGLGGESDWHSHRVNVPVPVPNATNCTIAQGQGLGAQDLQTLYGYTGVTMPGSGETIVILGTGGAPSPSNDVGAYVTAYGLATSVATQYKQVFVGGPNRDPAAQASNEYGENVLDAEMVLALAPYATVQHVLTATNGAGLFSDGIAYIVNDATLSKAHAVTVSYGTCERGSASEMPILNALFAQAQAEGQQWFFASGDSATDGCRDGSGNKIISAGWPASSPFAVGVGGSSFGPTAPATVTVSTVEVPWADGGGGPSETFDKPAYQTGVGAGTADGARDTPDVAAFADPNPGVCTTTNGKTLGGTGGTSAAAPMWAAIWAVTHQSVHAAKGEGAFKTGLVTIYSVGKNIASGTTLANAPLKDITSGAIKGPGGGTNGYTAVAGYDLASGWGTPNLARLIAVWQ